MKFIVHFLLESRVCLTLAIVHTLPSNALSEVQKLEWLRRIESQSLIQDILCDQSWFNPPKGCCAFCEDSSPDFKWHLNIRHCRRPNEGCFSSRWSSRRNRRHSHKDFSSRPKVHKRSVGGWMRLKIPYLRQI